MLLLRLDNGSKRARYIAEHFVRVMLGWDLSITTSLEEFRSTSLPRLSYSVDRPDVEAYHIPSSGWLREGEIVPFSPPVAKGDAFPVLFPHADGADIFAGGFYLLSRYEEYLQQKLDGHGRLPSSAHFVVNNGMERLPVVDHWALALADGLRSLYPGLPLPRREYGHTITLDVDNGLKYLGRPFWQQGAAALRDLAMGKADVARERIGVLRGKQDDPFNVYERFVKAGGDGGVERAIAFFLVRGGGKFDHAADISHPAMAAAIKGIAASAQLGIHPSYQSSADPDLILAEKDRLSKVGGMPIQLSRQHFLRWSMPGTLRALENAGIREDHSLGFTDRPGFRAGTCTPFRWYDLQQERVSDLVLHPFAVMDSALHDRQGMAPQAAIETFMEMNDAVRGVQGRFITVWHDRFLSGHGSWAGWDTAFDKVIQKAAP